MPSLRGRVVSLRALWAEELARARELFPDRESLLTLRFTVSGRMTRAAGIARRTRPDTWHVSLARFLEIDNVAEVEIRDTIRHELAHVLAGIEAGHGPVWKGYARRIGARPVACVPRSVARYVRASVGLRCASCGRIISGVGPRSRIARTPQLYRTRCCRAPLQRAPELDSAARRIYG